MKVAILNGYKMILPKYGKLNSLYGIFTSEGFVYCNDIENHQNIVIDEVVYDALINISIEGYENLNYPEY